jgi:hypothetical protein
MKKKQNRHYFVNIVVCRCSWYRYMFRPFRPEKRVKTYSDTTNNVDTVVSILFLFDYSLCDCPKLYLFVTTSNNYALTVLYTSQITIGHIRSPQSLTVFTSLCLVAASNGGCSPFSKFPKGSFRSS